MKRLKILPSVLMLVLCVGVLCMGIYAASPNSNQITGSITINAANPEVVFSAYLGATNGEELASEVPSRTGAEIPLESEDLVLDLSSASTIDEVDPIVIYIKAVNKSTSEVLGAYFANEAKMTTAEYGDIITTQPIYEDPEAQELNVIANANVPFYTVLPKATVSGGVTTYYPVYMKVTIKPAKLIDYALEDVSFTLNLNVEGFVIQESAANLLVKTFKSTGHPDEVYSDNSTTKAIIYGGDELSPSDPTHLSSATYSAVDYIVLPPTITKSFPDEMASVISFPQNLKAIYYNGTSAQFNALASAVKSPILAVNDVYCTHDGVTIAKTTN